MDIKKVNIYQNKIKLAVTVLLSLVSAAMLFLTFPAAALWIVAFCALGFISVKLTSTKGSVIVESIAAPIGSLFTLYFSELINIVGHETLIGYHSLFAYMNKRFYTTDTAVSLRFPIEILLFLIFYFILRAFFSIRVSLSITPAPFLLLALANYYVYSFRGSELLFSDLFGAGTAAHVAAGYSYPIMMPLTFIAIPYVLFILAAINIKNSVAQQRKPLSRLIPVGCAILSFLILIPIYNKYTTLRPVYAYQDQGSQANGVTVNFLMSATTLKLHKPDGYDKGTYASLVTAEPTTLTDTPNVIVIMNESLADLSIYSDIIGDLESDPLAYIHSLSSESIQGEAYASVFGGRTANSEFEYLTGISVYGLPEGMLPYPMKINSETYSMATYLSSCGYRTTAVHPYVGDGWDRDIVYPLLGFENTMFIDDFSWNEEDMINGYMTDECLYRNILNDIDSSSDGRPNFYFIVSIQNHGGYSGDMRIPGHTDYVSSDVAYAEEINNYLSLSHLSDTAFEYLVNELSARDEEYVVVMFGDHQPNLSFNSLYTAANGNGWIIPYIIWDNHGLDAADTQTDGITSINYLAIDTLNAAGIPLSPYYEYLSNIREDIPCINSAGYVSLVSDDETLNDLNQISGLQYYALEDS